MKFAEHLGAHITPEWRKQYIQYEASQLVMKMVKILINARFLSYVRVSNDIGY